MGRSSGRIMVIAEMTMTSHVREAVDVPERPITMLRTILERPVRLLQTPWLDLSGGPHNSPFHTHN